MAQDNISLFFCHKGTFLVHGQLVVHQVLQVLFWRAALQLVSYQSVLVPEFTPAQVHGFAFPLIKLHQVPI